MNLVIAERCGPWKRLRRGTRIAPGDLLQVDPRAFKDHGRGIMLLVPNQTFIDELRAGSCDSWRRPGPHDGSLYYWDRAVHAASCWPMLVLSVLEVDVRPPSTWRRCFQRDYPLESWVDDVPDDPSTDGVAMLLDPPRLVLVHDSHNDANRIFWTCV